VTDVHDRHTAWSARGALAPRDALAPRRAPRDARALLRPPRLDERRAPERAPGQHRGLVLLPGREAQWLEAVAARARGAGLQRVHVLAWRDLEDPEAGGSEVHAHRIASLWSDAGIDVTMRTSTVSGAPPTAVRHGYQVLRRSGRYAVFPRSILSGLTGRRPDGLVEVWNGMPFFSPLWARCPSVVFLHHVHAEMWRMALPPALGHLGEFVERRAAPPLYRRSRIVTLSSSSRDEIVSMLGFHPGRVSVVAPGIDPRFSPGGSRSPEPSVVAVGRLVPVKRFDLLVEALVEARRGVPNLRATIVGEGYERPRLEAQVRAAGAQEWMALPGHLTHERLLDLYRRAWVVASTSKREGWGMTVSEAGACATPAVVSRIAGHVDSVEHDVGGLVVDLDRAGGPAGVGRDRRVPGTADEAAAFADALRTVLRDRALRTRLGLGAQAHARGLSWEAAAAGTLETLVEEAVAGR